MVRQPTFDRNGMKKGAWSKEEDHILRDYVHKFGHHNWRRLPFLAGLARCGKSCRLRWVNYLKPGLKRGKFAKHEDELIIKLHDQLGSKWSAIAVKMPGRTDNEIKNYWHAHIKKHDRRGGIRSSSSFSSSSEINSCVTTDHQEKPADQNLENVDSLYPTEDLYSFARDDQDDLLIAPYQTCTIDSQFFVDSPQHFGMFQEMQNDTSNSSDGGSSFCNA